MAVISESQGRQDLFEPQPEAWVGQITLAASRWGKYRHSLLFAATAVVVMAIAATFAATKVNGVIAGVAEDQVTGLAEENTTRDALHIQSMIRGGEMMAMGHDGEMTGMESGSGMTDMESGSGMTGMESGSGMTGMESGSGMTGMESDSGMTGMESGGGMTGMESSDAMAGQNAALTLASLTGPAGLPAQFSSLVEGLGVVESSLFDIDGNIVWSTDPTAIGKSQPNNRQIELAVSGAISSNLIKDQEVVGLDGTSRRMDLVETYVPMQNSPSEPVFGVLEINRDVGTDLSLLVDETKAPVIWTTVGTMAGLFLALLGFVVVSDRSIYRSHQRHISLVEERLAERMESEQKLSERALELETSNHELEAFSYSVSHDLRSPLRAIDGFSQALLEDYGDKLDEEGRSALDRVRAGTQRMGVLIDAMLQMSRVSRGEIYREDVDISDMARAITAEFKNAEPERQAEFVIADGMVAHADARLLRGVFQNLLANAWKFTSKHAQARIEVGTKMHEGKLTYFVRDDGAGFDMAFADKLFGAFQRLHRVSEFEGIGVGLATAQRIVHRHSGLIWADGEVEKGATVYFTLGSG